MSLLSLIETVLLVGSLWSRVKQSDVQNVSISLIKASLLVSLCPLRDTLES